MAYDFQIQINVEVLQIWTFISVAKTCDLLNLLITVLLIFSLSIQGRGEIIFFLNIQL